VDLLPADGQAWYWEALTMGAEPRRRVLVVGSGGREHALARKLADSPSVSEVVVAPGNAGTERTARNASPLGPTAAELAALAVEERVDLAVIGPEAPLVAGVADELRKRGIPAFGPSAKAAELEGSKAFMKRLAAEQGIPTARFGVFSEPDHAVQFIRAQSKPLVVKADGLCAGKGVVVAESPEEAEDAARSMLSGDAFGDAGRTIVIEERLEGTEASVHAICDGTRYVLLPAVQDHKRIGDGDRGPNTGGMGAYGPTPLVTPEMEQRIAREVIEPALKGLADRGTPFCGALFAGLMIEPDGTPNVLEYNVRFGDPETEVLMELVEGDLGEILYAAAIGQLDPSSVRRAARHAVAVVLAAEGYPGAPRRGDPITGLEQAAALPGVSVLHAGTVREGDEIVTAGGRVLVVTAAGDSLRMARDRAYEGVACIHFRGMQHRRDIGERALK
jgi:phosphoribosylamine--glycine ligase